MAPLELRNDPKKLLAYAAGGFLFAALAAGVAALGRAQGPGVVAFAVSAVGAFGFVFFGAIAVLALARLFVRTPVITITADGIHDVRLSAAAIPWHAIETVSLQRLDSQKFIMLDLAPEYERAVGLARGAALTRALNAAVGMHGYCLNIAGLDSPAADVVAAIQYFSAPRTAEADGA